MKFNFTFELLEQRQMMAAVCYDNELKTLYSRFNADNYLTRTEVISLFQNSTDGGVVNAIEAKDLKNIVTQSNLPADVKSLAGKVLQGSPISPLDMGSLLDKWFYGKDRPSLQGYPNATYSYVDGKLFVNGPSSSDVRQGSVGDCYFLASLQAMSDKYKSAVTDMFKDNFDGTWSVRFYKFSGATRIADYVTVDRYLPVNSSGNAVFNDFKNGNSNELWVSLAEKAYAQWAKGNSWSKLSGGYADAVFKDIAEAETTQSFNPGSRVVQNNLISAVQRGLPVVIYAFLNGSRTSAHAFYVKSYTNGYFELVNPWGYWDVKLDMEGIKNDTYGYAVLTRIALPTSPKGSAFATLSKSQF